MIKDFSMVYIRKKTKTDKIESLKQKAIDLYFAGFTTREIEKKIGMSRTSVSRAVREFRENNGVKMGQGIDKDS